MNKLQWGKYRKHTRKSTPYIMAWFGMCVGILIIAYGITITLVDFGRNAHEYQGIAAKLWFGYFQQFTILTNVHLIVFYFLFLFFYRTKIFNNNRFLVFTTSYIILVFIIAWFVIAPIFVFNNTVKVDILESVEIILIHLISPILFVTFGIFAMKYQGAEKHKTLPLANTWMLAFIWPLIYFTYLVVINFIPMPASMFRWAGNESWQLHPGHYYVSIYGILTDYNPKCLIPVWDTNTNSGEWVYQSDNVGIGDGKYNNTGSAIRSFIVPLALSFHILETFILTYINNRLNGAYLPYKPYRRSR